MGGGADCKNTNNVVGTVDISCSNSNGNAVFKLFNYQAQVIPAANAVNMNLHYYVGCTSVTAPACTPPSFGAARTETCSANKRCGGAARGILDQNITVTGCACRDIFFIFHQSASASMEVAHTVPRDANGQCTSAGISAPASALKAPKLF